jgi:MarR family transcriptional regulator, organic hydroperoxide resistance regulator
MDYTKRKGGAALGARLRRLSEAIDRDATRAYATVGVKFEQRWFGVLNQLALHGPKTVSEIAATLRITRASVSQTRQSLENAGFIEMEAHPLDARQRHLVLTNAGVKLLGRLQPLWQAMEAAALEVDAEAGNAVAALDRLDEVLARQSLFERILAKLSNAPQSSRNSRSKNRSTIS